MAPLYLVAHPGQPRPQVAHEFGYEPAGVDVFSGLFSGKARREKHGPRIWACSTRWRLHGSGYPQVLPAGATVLRRASDENAAIAADFESRIKALSEEYRRHLVKSWESGTVPHASEAENYPKQVDGAA